MRKANIPSKKAVHELLPESVRRPTIVERPQFAGNRLLILTLASVGLWVSTVTAQESPGGDAKGPSTSATESESSSGVEAPTTRALAAFLRKQTPTRLESLEALESNWDINLVPFIRDSLTLVPADDPRNAVLWQLLKRMTGQSFRSDTLRAAQWLWKQEFTMHPDYPEFKAAVHAPIDPRFQWWFYRGMAHTIRLDEIMWRGVKVDGIPPLNHPSVISAEEATYLGKKNIVFGIYINGEARAYPKRVLAWHEMTNDTVGGMDLTLVYCTLCGAAILYDQQVGDRQFEFGTSGFLYRSNKLMYDRETRSLWSALEGVPVTGKLVGSGLRLKRLPIVTTTWGAWRKAHPETRVLSLETGHQRDYGEGVAYRDYFATDRLMFPVPFDDKRLKNKREVLAVILGREPVAFDTSFLEKHALHHDTVGRRNIVILTDSSGANRVYDAKGVTFSKWDRKVTLVDQEGQTWQVTENALLGPTGHQLDRLAAHRAFWFGWHAQFPQSRLVR